MNSGRRVNYHLLAAQAEALLSGQQDRVANAANLGALLYQEIPDINWAGFYFHKGEKLILGPFQGKPACVEIPMGQGVCGTAAATGEVQRISDVHSFDGHIVCDTDSESELVIPLHKAGDLIGVLDIDSPYPDRFDQDDEAGLVAISEIYLQSIR